MIKQHRIYFARLSFSLSFVAFLLISACGQDTTSTEKQNIAQSFAPGAPGVEPVWSYAGKTGIGTSYEAYANKQHSNTASTGEVSKVWFSIAKGVVTETMFGLIHHAQLKELQFIVVGEDFIDWEMDATNSKIEYLSIDDSGRPTSLAYRVITRDKQNLYEIEKHIFTHPDKQALFIKTFFRSLVPGLKPYLMINPHMANTGVDDRAEVTDYGLHAWQDDQADQAVHLSVISSNAMPRKTVGFFAGRDAINQQLLPGPLAPLYVSTGEQTGNVYLLAELSAGDKVLEFDTVLGFGKSEQFSLDAAQKTLSEGYDLVLAKYNGEGENIGWQDYLAQLPQLQDLSASTNDGGKLLNVSAMVLKAQEDKTYSGALIASLSNPWGDTTPAVESATGYKAVWPRDFYQCAMALLALGDKQTALVAFEYLKQVQVNSNTPGNKGAGGWFLQKTHVDGELEWVAVQLDQTAMPIMLAWKLWQNQVLSDEQITHWYQSMLKPAAEFLVDGGKVDLDWNKAQVTPPRTQQERWEEQEGFSPSSTAALIAGLVSAADIAQHTGDKTAAQKYLTAADKYAASIEKTMFTDKGKIAKSTGIGGENSNGEYYLRITQNPDPNDNGKLLDRNGRGELNEAEILDGGFLELVRYGVRAANDPHILNSLPEYDDINLPDELRVKYEFIFDGSNDVFPGWRRYGDDGYGENASNGDNYAVGGVMSPGQRGRVWPFFTGERGHYELAYALSQDKTTLDAKIDQIKNTYIRALELFANQGLMLPEQVWDGVGMQTHHQAKKGEGTNSATPLAWTHAEYIKLVRSVHDRQVWDNYPLVGQRYNGP